MFSQQHYQIKLGLDASPLCHISGGIGFSIYYLLDELVRLRTDVLFVLYAPSNKGDIVHFEQYRNVKIRAIPQLSQCHSLWTQTTLASVIWKDDLDYFWGSTQYIPLLSKKKLKTMITLHDFVYIFYPESVSWIKCQFMKMLSKRFFQKADYVFSISRGTAEKLKTIYGIESADIVNPPVKKTITFKTEEECFSIISSRKLIYKKFALTVGSLEPRKNLLELMNFYEKLLNTNDPASIYPLVIVGGGGWKNKSIINKMKQLSALYPNNFIHLGFVSDNELSYFYSAATFFISLSVYEGYGMPLAESRICNTPIVCFDLPEMKEAAENDGTFLNRDSYHEELSYIFKITEQEKKKEMIKSYPLNDFLAAKIAACIE